MNQQNTTDDFGFDTNVDISSKEKLANTLCSVARNNYNPVTGFDNEKIIAKAKKYLEVSTEEINEALMLIVDKGYT